MARDLMANIPQLFWDLPEGKPSLIRYHYHDHIAERLCLRLCGHLRRLVP